MTGENLVRAVDHALRCSRHVRAVRHVGSRARGDATALSDWDFHVDVADFLVVAAQLPQLVAPLSPVTAQWDRLSEQQCYMLLLRGPRKVDLIFDEPHVVEPPWQVTRGTLGPMDEHFWDWVLWVAAKQLAGRHDLVETELTRMSHHLLVPMGVERVPGGVDEALAAYVAARSMLEEQLGVQVSRAAEREVAPVLTGR